MYIIAFFIISSTCWQTGCDTTDPPPDTRKLTLTFEDASCTEAWIKLTTENLQLPAEINLTRTDEGGNSVSHISILNTKDSLFYIDSLLPNKSYTFKAELSSIQHPVSSNELNVTTMGTTSHNFAWQIFSFGEHSPSTLYDVAIIDNNNILVAGTIYLKDSLEQEDPQPYSIAKWDGNKWELKKLFDQNNLIITAIRGILVLSSNNIYLAAGSIYHWDGSSSIVELVYSRLNLPNPNGTIEKLWGSSNSSIYGVGNAGSSVFYNGNNWKVTESGTDVDLLDVWGSPDGSVVWACGYYRDRAGTFLLRSTGGNFEMTYDGTANEFKILQDTISGVNNESVEFVEIPDTFNINNQNDLNSYLVSEPFDLTDNSVFTYGVKFGITDSLSAASSLSNGREVNFKVQLVDDQTGEVLGTLNDVTYSEGNIIPFENLAYQVNTQGIGNRTCKLKVKAEDNLAFNYSLVNSYNNSSSLYKKGFVEIPFKGDEVITTYDLFQNYPNPFNPKTTIKYQIPKDGLVTLKVYDILGKEVKALVNEHKSTGRYEVRFDASALASGVYIYRIQVNDYVSSKKMMLVK